MNNIEKLIKQPNLENKEKILNDFKLIIEEKAGEYFSSKTMFSKSNINIYYYDEYKLNTNTCNNTPATLYMEINQVLNIKPSNSDKLIKDRYLTLKTIKDDLFDILINIFDSNTLIWQDKYSINFAINVFNENNEKFTHYFNLIPCFTYTNENNISGIIYYSNDKSLTEIEYPKLSIRNFNLKNKSTNDLFRQYIILFRNAYMIEKNEKDLPFEIYEILLYNVPDSYFTDLNYETILNIINYIKTCGIQSSKTIDYQQEAFISKYKSLSSLYASMAIKKIDKFFNKNKTELSNN